TTNPYLREVPETAALSLTGAVGYTHAWRRALLSLTAVVAWVLGWYASTAASMVETWWRSSTFTHGFVVPPIALWLIWRQRAALVEIPPHAELGWIVIPVTAGFAWLLGELAVINVLTQFALL